MTVWVSRRALKALSLACIALALGVTTAVFTVVDGLFHRDPPFPNSDALAVLTYRSVAGEPARLSYDIAMAAERQRLRAAIIESGLVESTTQIGPSTLFSREAERARLYAASVDVNFFSVLGIGAFRGSLHPADLRQSVHPGAPPTVVLGHELWLRLGEPAIGPTTVAERAVVVAAILPKEVKYPGETNIWVVQREDEARPPTLVRLAPGINAEDLAARVEPLHVQTLGATLRPSHAETVVVLFLAAALVVLIAWVQLAGFTVADLLGRMRDFGVRLSLGATPQRVLAESAATHAVTAAIVAVAALVVTAPSLRMLILSLPPELTFGQYVSIGPRSIGFLALTVAVGFGVLAWSPAWALRVPPLLLMRGQVDGMVAKVTRLRRVLVVAQVAMGAALLYVTTLLGHSLANAVHYDYGFATDEVVLFEPPAIRGDADFEARDRAKGELTRVTVEELNLRHDVIAAAVLYRAPLTRPSNHTPWEPLRSIGGRPAGSGAQAYSTTVGPRFAAAIGATILQGYGFDHPEAAGRRDVVLVNATFVRMFGGGIDVAGARLGDNLVGQVLETPAFRGTIIGVVQDLVFSKVSDPPVPQMFIPERAIGAAPFVAIRAPGGMSTLDQLKPTLEQRWGPLPEHRFTPLQDLWEQSLRPYRGQAELVGLLASFAIPLAGVGVASFMMFAVRGQRRAIAIRLAVGAEPRQVRDEVLRRGAVTVACGVAAGLVIGLGLSRLLGARLFGVATFDFASFTLTLLLFGILALAATWLPARLASDTDPAVLLRENSD